MSFHPRRLFTSLSYPVMLAALLCSASPAMALPLDSLYATGVDDSGVPIADGATDTHWEVSVSNGAFVSALSEKNNYCTSCGGIWLEWPNGDQLISRGITHPSHVRDSGAPGRFMWRHAFDVPVGADLSSVTLSYRVGFDDLSRNAADNGDLSGCNHTVWLNGTAYAMTATGSPQNTQCVGVIPAGAAFVEGQNTIEFRITNVGGYYGFRLEQLQGSYELATVCGDGLVEGSEACDDGNVMDGDGCSASCEVEDGFGCTEPELVFNGDFEFGDTGTFGVLPVDPNPAQSLCGAQDFAPRDGYYYVTSSPYQSCTCDGGQGLCLALNGGGGVVWAQTLTGLLPNTTYAVSARHALKAEASPANEPRLELLVDGVTLASAAPSTPGTPVPYATISATFTTGPAQTTATLEFTNPVNVGAGNDAVLDSISVTGPSVCAPPCGDGVITSGEACDDGNMVNGDGCSSSCEVESLWSCAGNVMSTCTLLCGNGLVDPGETCDDGNTIGGDGCSATCLDERISLPLYSTGVDDSGIPLADGATDTHWQVSVSGGAFFAALNDQNNYCVSCAGGTWLEWPIGDPSNSRGITHPDFVRTATSPLTFVWKQEFTLPPGARPDTATITYRVGFDDFSRNAADDGDLSGCNHTVWLNGTAYAMTATGDHFRTQCEATLPAGSAFTSGQNTIEFRISNRTTFYGFRLDRIEGTFLLSCGDGALASGEACDDGNTDEGDGCSASCEIEQGYECDGEPSTCVLAPACGDGMVDMLEACDDGNTVNGDGCSSLCKVEEGYMCSGEPSGCEMIMSNIICGDGMVDMLEACDDGNTVNGDGCSSLCKVEEGYTCSGEPSGCEMNVIPSACGNGKVDVSEACDDGNTVNGDGCSSLCKVEEGYACKGAPSVCEAVKVPPVCGDGMVAAGEMCDDGNTISGDGCSASCEVEKEEMMEPMMTGTDDSTTDEGCSSVSPSQPAGSGLLWCGLMMGLCAWTRRRRATRIARGPGA